MVEPVVMSACLFIAGLMDLLVLESNGMLFVFQDIDPVHFGNGLIIIVVLTYAPLLPLPGTHTHSYLHVHAD